MTAIAFDNSYARDLPDTYVPWQPVPVKTPRLLFFNRELARELGLDTDALAGPEGAEVFAGNTVPAGAKPIAQAYAGHQFGGFRCLGLYCRACSKPYRLACCGHYRSNCRDCRIRRRNRSYRR